MKARTAVLVFAAVASAGTGALLWRRAARPGRGIVLISIDTLRADRLGAYGHGRPTSPFLDSLAARGVLFENAIVQVPGTLPSHMSMFTGLYPAEHGVYPPLSALSTEIRTVPEVLRRRGFRTAGHSEGVYVDGRYGFARGFEQWSSEFIDPVTGTDGTPVKDADSVRRTFGRGLAFVRGLRAHEPFFVFLHTYATHDPYAPPEPYRSQYWPGPPPPGVFPPTGEAFSRYNRSGGTVSPVALEYYRALYDAQIRWVDDALRDLLAGLQEAGVAERTTVIVTSDHGEEFLEHGRFVHEQVYDECLHVPLIVAGPGLPGGRRVRNLARTVDLAPTVYELAGVPAAERPASSGRSLVPLLAGGPEAPASEAYAEAVVTADRALYQQAGGRLLQLVRREPLAEAAGTWIARAVSFDASTDELHFFAESFHRPRQLQVSVDGGPPRVLPIRPDGSWLRFPLGSAAGLRRVELSADGCVSPAELGQNPDTRCLAFRVRGVSLGRAELYDFTGARRNRPDEARARPEESRALDHRLRQHRWSRVAAPETASLDAALKERLRGLGYLH